jgi:cytochrome c553
MFESSGIPAELSVAEGLRTAFSLLPEAQNTLVMLAQSLEQAAPVLDDFKARTCGSPVTLGVINLSAMPSLRDLDFLLKNAVLGDPRTVFLASLKTVDGECYARAREKVTRESADVNRSPSCIDCYGAPNRDEVYPRISQLIAAYIRETEQREATLRTRGAVALEDSMAIKLLKKSETTFFGRSRGSARMTDTQTRLKPVDPG